MLFKTCNFIILCLLHHNLQCCISSLFFFYYGIQGLSWFGISVGGRQVGGIKIFEVKNAAQLPCDFESYPCRSYKHNVRSEGTCYPTGTRTSVASFTQTLQCLSKEQRPLSLSTQHTNNNFHFITQSTRCALRFATTPWAQHTTSFHLIPHFHSQTHKHKATSITPVDFMTPYLILLWLLVYAVQLSKTIYGFFFFF